MRQNVIVRDQFFAKQFGDKFACDVIGGRAESAGSDDEVGAAQRLAHGVLDSAAGVRDCYLPRNDVTKIREPATKPLLVRVQDATQHQFTAGIDDFDIHGGFNKLRK